MNEADIQALRAVSVRERRMVFLKLSAQAEQARSWKAQQEEEKIARRGYSVAKASSEWEARLVGSIEVKKNQVHEKQNCGLQHKSTEKYNQGQQRNEQNKRHRSNKSPPLECNLSQNKMSQVDKEEQVSDSDGEQSQEKGVNELVDKQAKSDGVPSEAKDIEDDESLQYTSEGEVYCSHDERDDDSDGDDDDDDYDSPNREMKIRVDKDLSESDEADDDDTDSPKPESPAGPDKVAGGAHRDYLRLGESTERFRRNITELPKRNAPYLNEFFTGRKMQFEEQQQERPQSGSEPSSPISIPRIMADNLPLVRRFNVIKYHPRRRITTKRTRIWEVDFLRGQIRNIDRQGRAKKTHSSENLLLVEKHVQDNKRALISFIGERHSYELRFKTAQECDQFYELALALRPFGLVWCPSLCPPEDDMCTVVIEAGSQSSVSQGDLSDESEDANITDNSQFGGASSAVKTSPGEAMINVSRNGTEQIKVFCGTWNMGSAAPPADFAEMEAFIQPDYDIYALSFQECGSAEDSITRYIQKYLGEAYVTLGSVVLWAIRLVVLVKEEHVAKISCIEIGQRATGFLNIMGNKGGLGIAFKFYETSMCFIGCHLAAREERIEQRNTNVYEISNDLSFGFKELDPAQFDYSFWMGDFNYRVDLPFDDGLKLAEEKRYDKLLENDQLLRLMEQGTVFHGYKEGEIHFPPSYRYDIGSREFSHEKSRTPSYCDRILYRALPENKIIQHRYDSPSSITTSDHNPVYSTFTIETRLRYVSQLSPPETQLAIRLSNLYVSGRSGSLINKVHVTFFAPWAETVQVTSTKAKKYKPMVNPRIDDASLPVLRPVVSHRSYLERQHLLIALRDFALGNNPVENMIGYGALSLREAVNSDEPVDFVIDLSNKFRVGRLSGRIHVFEED